MDIAIILALALVALAAALLAWACRKGVARGRASARRERDLLLVRPAALREPV